MAAGAMVQRETVRSLFEQLKSILIEPPSNIRDVELRHKSRLLNIFLLPMILVFVGVDAVYLATVPGYMPPWYGYLFLLGSYALNHTRFHRVAAFVVLVMFPIVISANIISGSAASPLTVLYYLIPGLILGGILLSFWVTAIFALIEILVILWMPLVEPVYFGGFSSIVGPLSALVISAVLVLVSMQFRDRIEKDRRESLRGAEEKYRNIFENVIDGIFQSTPDGKFVSVNPALARMYGYDTAEEMIQNITDIPSQLYVEPSLRDDLRQRLENGEQVQGLELQAYRREKSTFWVSINARVVRAADGSPLYYEGTVEDITTRKHMEQEREKLIGELEAKNAELERFTYTVSHDLKSPLVTINGFLGHIEADALSGNLERLKHDSQRIQAAVVQMYALLNELLELSRIGRMMNPPETIPFADLVGEALQIVKGGLDARGVAVQVQPRLPDVYGDRRRLTEVLQNLLDNAAKFMGDQPAPRLEIGTQGEENGKPIFFVRDNGIGIAPEYHTKVFGLFNKLDPEAEGTGIGLAVVKRIIEVHGGRIWVEGEAGKGSTFYFTLPKPPA
jgi:PAS domain S-box-containing protein